MPNLQMVFALVLLFTGIPSQAAEGATYGGLEYFGSSQMTRNEVEKSLRLRPGSSEKSVATAVENFRNKLEKLRLSANVQMVSDGPDKVVVVVDFEDRVGTGISIPTRILKNPHHVITQSEKPQILLEKLRDRIDRLNSEGREWTDSYPGGVRVFSDEPANQLTIEIRRFGPAMRDDWLSVVESDPDKNLRLDAIELLNWAPNYVDTCVRLIPAIDDSHYEVRSAADQFIYPRLDMLPPDFPFDQLGMALTRQLKRPSHADRSKSIRFILALIKRYPQMTAGFKQMCEADVEQIASKSQISALRKSAEELAVILRAPLPKERAPGIPGSGF